MKPLELEDSPNANNSLEFFLQFIKQSSTHSPFQTSQFSELFLNEQSTFDTEELRRVEKHLSEARGYLYYPQIESVCCQMDEHEIAGTKFSAGIVRLRVAQPGKRLEHALVLTAHLTLSQQKEGHTAPLVVLLQDGSVITQVTVHDEPQTVLFNPPYADIEKLLSDDDEDVNPARYNQCLEYSDHVYMLYQDLQEAFLPEAKDLGMAYKASLLTLVAMDAYRSKLRNYQDEYQQIFGLFGRVDGYSLHKQQDLGILSEKLRGYTLSSLLSYTVKESLIPSHVDIYVVEDYREFLRALHISGTPLPRFAGNFSDGFYASFSADWEDMDVSQGIADVFKQKQVRFSKGIIVPAELVRDQRKNGNELLAALRYHALFAVYDQMPASHKRKLISFGEKHIPDVRVLFAFTHIQSSDVPLIDKDRDEYAFDQYPDELKHWFLSNAVVSAIVEEDRRPKGRPIWGDGSDKWHFLPKGMMQVLSEIGWHTTSMPITLSNQDKKRQIFW
jgi:hypothetical protein